MSDSPISKEISKEEQALIDAVVANLDDDSPRFVYADWMTSKGDPRGEFITLQCRGAVDEEAKRKLKVAENKMLKAHASAWGKPLLDVLPPKSSSFLEQRAVTFGRGFLDGLEAAWSALRVLDKIFAVAPALTSLDVAGDASTDDSDLPALLSSPLLSRLRRLKLTIIGGGNNVATAVAAAQHLHNLTDLTLHASMPAYANNQRSVNVDGARALARSPYLRKLKRLDLGNSPINEDGLTEILSAPWKLEEFVLSNQPRPQGLGAAFAAAKGEPTIQRLILSNVKIPPADLGKLAAAKVLANLEMLDLEFGQIGEKGVKALFTKLPPKLRELYLERNGLTDRGVAVLAEQKTLQQLRVLNLGHNRMGQGGGVTIANAANFAGLEKLYLAEPRFKDETKVLLAGSPHLAKVKVFLSGKLLVAGEPPPAPKAVKKPAKKRHK
jgi:uncharacterized protein (TIGR02996 family)